MPPYQRSTPTARVSGERGEFIYGVYLISQSTLVPKLKGVDLFGFYGALSSQRVSFAVAEKGLKRGKRVPWQSAATNHVSAESGTYTIYNVPLIKHHNLTEAYAAIQANMVQPALVHYGALHVESLDIIDYLDQKWPENPLMPTDPAAAQLCQELVEQGKQLHVFICHIRFNWSLGKMGKINSKTEATVKLLEVNGSPEKLAEIYTNLNRNDISRETFTEHLHALEAACAAQEERLKSDGRQFLIGSTFCPAAIIRGIKVLRQTECGYPFAQNFQRLRIGISGLNSAQGAQTAYLLRIDSLTMYFG